MALGKYSRVDGRRPASSYCSTVTVVVFVGLCLVGVWMMTSSVVVPDDSSSPEAGSGVKQQVPKNGGSFGNDDNSEVKEKVPENDKLPVGDGMDGKEDGAKEESPVTVNNSPEESSETQTQSAPDTENDAVKENELQKQDDRNGTPVKDNGDGKNGSNNALEGESQASEGENQGDKGREAEVGEKNKDTGDEGTDSGKNETTEGEQDQGQPETKVTETVTKGMEQNSTEENSNTEKLKELLPDPSQSDLLNETHTQTGSWSTQADESQNEKKVQKPSNEQLAEYSWKLCNVSAGPDYMPCLNNVEAIKKLKTTKHYEHRERHCPAEGPTCLVPLPNGYKPSIRWPDSRKKIWYANVPHTKLVAIKGHQNWVKESGEFLTFPGGGTQFKHGALHYIDFIQESFPEIAWGKKSRVVLDVGCGVASFGGFLFDRDVLTMSFAPNDEHEAQVQFALERGIPAISAVMGTKRLPFPSNVFDVVHCARCRVPWHVDGGMLLLELNRLLRPGGYFVWSATPVYRKTEEDVGIWKAMSELTKSICWEMVSITKDAVDEVGIAIYKKPSSNECYEKRLENNPPFCKVSDDPNAAWYIQLQPCLHQVPTDPSVRGSQWPEEWPKKLETPPYWLNSSQHGVYGQAAPDDFNADYEHWKHVVSKSYLSGLGVDWSTVRNVMDMRSVYGGFAAALKEMKVWVMNVVPIDSADTLPIIYERGLFGIYHDWCESFSTYPRTYDLLHADHLFSKTKKRCSLLSVMAEADRILRPQGMIIVRDNVETINEVENIGKSLHWEIRLEYSKEKEGLLCMQKTMWRPEEVDTSI